MAYVQSKSVGAVGVTSLALTFTSSNTTDNRLIAAVLDLASTNVGSVSLTDDAGTPNSYTNHVDNNDGVNDRLVQGSANCTNGGGSARKITVTLGTADALTLVIAEYSGMSTASGASAIETTGVNFTNGPGTGTLTVSASPNPATAGETAVAFFSDFAVNAYTATSGTIRFQAAGSNGQFCLIDLPSVVGTTTASATVSGNGSGDNEIMVVYKLAAVATITTPQPIIVNQAVSRAAVR